MAFKPHIDHGPSPDSGDHPVLGDHPNHRLNDRLNDWPNPRPASPGKPALLRERIPGRLAAPAASAVHASDWNAVRTAGFSRMAGFSRTAGFSRMESHDLIGRNRRLPGLAAQPFYSPSVGRTSGSDVAPPRPPGTRGAA